MNRSDLREQCAQKLHQSAAQVNRLSAFLGLDGFVDEIIHVVDKRDNAESYQRLPTIGRLAERLADAAGHSTNIELVNARTKLGGNGPILANALASFGLKITYVGALGFPNVHPVFQSFAQKAEVHSISDSGHTDALEFEDGKIMLVKSTPLNDITWANIEARFGRERFSAKLHSADLVAFVNWTMIPHMSDLWEALLDELCPALPGPRRRLFFDLADPEKRKPADIAHALQLIARFEKYFHVTLGLNEKEAYEIAEVLGLPITDKSRDGVSHLARQIQAQVPVQTLVIHPVAYALAVSCGRVDLVEGPFTAKPLITTGAGDHFNAGFCLGKLLGFDNELSLLTGVTTSGYYVRTAHSPSIQELVEMLQKWRSN
ncbi:MAG: hypothetical protein HY674_09545 [Chloroflexi bacterium]|nr:hypothetical protein [Chloroflexota bacterium]